MNLQAIQERIEEMSAELLTLSNDLTFILQGDVTRERPQVVDPKSHWAWHMKPGDLVKCVSIQSTNDTRLRCFTIGKIYTVESRLSSDNPEDYNYGVRISRDDENESHDANQVVFVKVA